MALIEMFGGVGCEVPALRVTEPEEPSRDGDGAEAAALAHAYWTFGMGEQYREEAINHSSALKYSAVWGCVRVISQSIASVGWHVYDKSGRERKQVALTDGVAWMLGSQANPEMTTFEFVQVLLKDALTWGNGFAEIERDGMGKPRWLWRISPDRVSVERIDSQLVYVVENGPGEKPTMLRPADVYHIKGLGPDGIVGYSVISMAQATIRLGMEEERFGSRFFARGPMPGGVLEMAARLTPEAMEKQRESFQKLYGGSKNAGRVIVLHQGQKFTPLSLPNSDSQFLESRQFQVTEICRWYGVPPHKLADLARATFSNIEEQERAFVTDCLLPWARRMESEADAKLFTTGNRGKRFTRLNLDALMRGNSQTQTETVTKKVNNGLLTINEGREYFDLNPIEGGDTPLVQGAMMPLERALSGETSTDSANQPDGTPTQDEPTPNDQQPSNAVRDTFTRIMASNYARLIRVDADKAKRAHNKGRLDEHVGDYYTESAIEHVLNELQPIFAAFLLMCGKSADSAGALADAAAVRHVARCKSRLARQVPDFDHWIHEAREIADEEFKLAWESIQ